jgi:hypothetical protein
VIALYLYFLVGVGAAWKVADVEKGSTVAIFGLGAVGLAVRLLTPFFAINNFTLHPNNFTLIPTNPKIFILASHMIFSKN